jgi:DNA-binding response OmpR family regulator
MKKILIVDDDQSFLDLVKIMLNGNFDVNFASSAGEALAKIKALDYTAAILDVSLPDFTGYYLGKKIREIYPEMPLAFLTNYDGEVTKENAELINAVFWFKPNMVTSREKFINDVNKLVENV